MVRVRSMAPGSLPRVCEVRLQIPSPAHAASVSFGLVRTQLAWYLLVQTSKSSSQRARIAGGAPGAGAAPYKPGDARLAAGQAQKWARFFGPYSAATDRIDNAQVGEHTRAMPARG